MERWDVYDEDRLPTHRTAVRGGARRAGDCQLVVHVCLFNARGEMLIQQRQHGFWSGQKFEGVERINIHTVIFKFLFT